MPAMTDTPRRTLLTLRAATALSVPLPLLPLLLLLLLLLPVLTDDVKNWPPGGPEDEDPNVVTELPGPLGVAEEERPAVED